MVNKSNLISPKYRIIVKMLTRSKYKGEEDSFIISENELTFQVKVSYDQFDKLRKIMPFGFSL